MGSHIVFMICENIQAKGTAGAKAKREEDTWGLWRVKKEVTGERARGWGQILLHLTGQGKAFTFHFATPGKPAQ